MPQLSSFVTSLKPSVFATLNEKIKALSQPPICLHLGDTYALPPERARWSHLAERTSDYRYSHPFGLPELLEALAQKVREHNGMEASAAWIQVTCGATQALHCALQTLVEPGQSVMILAPYWPLFGGMTRCLGAEAYEVDCTPRLLSGEANLAELLERAYKPSVKALYFANPNNPDGYVYNCDELQVLAEFAQRHDLWVLSDECYEHYLYDDRAHLSIAALPGMEQRTVTAYSFSKSFAMAGHRLGYAVAPPGLMNALRRSANHTVYNVCSSVQRAGLETLREAREFCSHWLPAYSQARQQMGRALGRPAPAGGAYYFPRYSSAEEAWDVLERALQQGVVLAPGAAGGEGYADCLRICFTCVPPDELEKACQILARL